MTSAAPTPIIGVGLVGWGLAGTAFHGPLLATLPHLFSLRKVLRSPACSSSHVWGIPVATAFDELLADEHISLIVIASPDATHAAYARAALLAGRHVLIDKPFTESLLDTEGLLRLAVEKQLVCTSFHSRRYDADFLGLKQVLLSGVLGSLVEYEAAFDRYRPGVVESWKERSRGALANLGPHVIDQAVALFGAPSRVSGLVAVLRVGATTDDYWAITLHFDAGAERDVGECGLLRGAPPLRVSLKSSMLAVDNQQRYLVHGTLGSFRKGGLDVQEAVLRGLAPPPLSALVLGGAGAPSSPPSSACPPTVDPRVWEALQCGSSTQVLPGPLGSGWGAEPLSQSGHLSLAAPLQGGSGLRIQPGDSAVNTYFTYSVVSPPGDYHEYYVNLHAAITQQGPAEVTPRQIAVVHRIMEAARQSSAAGGVPVPL